MWGSASISSLPDVIACTDGDSNGSDCESQSSTLISLRVMLSDSSSCKGTYFDSFLVQIRSCLQALSQLNTNHGTFRCNLGEGELRGVVYLAGQIKEIVLLSVNILSEWLLSSTPLSGVLHPPPVLHNQHHQLLLKQQAKAVRTCQAVYSTYLTILETWDVLLRWDGGERGLMRWKSILDEHSDSLRCTDRTCFSVSRLEGAGVISYWTGDGDRNLNPDSLLNAVICLTVAFTERHLVGINYLEYVTFLIMLNIVYCNAMPYHVM